jgi:hypothetical protein
MSTIYTSTADGLAEIISTAAGDGFSIISETGLNLTQLQSKHSIRNDQIFVVLTNHKPHERYADSGLIMISEYMVYIKAMQNINSLVLRITEALNENCSFVYTSEGMQSLAYIIDEGGSYLLDNDLWYAWKIGVLS